MKCASCECSMYDANVVCIMRMYYVLCECVSLIVFCTNGQITGNITFYKTHKITSKRLNLNTLKLHS